MAIKMSAQPKVLRQPRTPMNEIPQDVKDAVEEALEHCTAYPDQRIVAEFESQAEADEFLHHARSYAFHRNPQVTVTGNSSKAGNAGFTVTAKPVSE